MINYITCQNVEKTLKELYLLLNNPLIVIVQYISVWIEKVGQSRIKENKKRTPDGRWLYGVLFFITIFSFLYCDLTEL